MSTPGGARRLSARANVSQACSTGAAWRPHANGSMTGAATLHAVGHGQCCLSTAARDLQPDHRPVRRTGLGCTSSKQPRTLQAVGIILVGRSQHSVGRATHWSSTCEFGSASGNVALKVIWIKRRLTPPAASRMMPARTTRAPQGEVVAGPACTASVASSAERVHGSMDARPA